MLGAPPPPTSRIVAISLLIAGCSATSAPSTTDAPDASWAEPAAGASALSVVGAISNVRELAPRLRAARSLVHANDGFRAARAGWSVLDARLPATADGVLRLESGRPGVFVEVQSEDLAPVAGEVASNALVFVDARPGTDVVHVAAGPVVEELRVLRSKDAEPVARYRLRVGPGVGSVRVRDGVVEVLDPEGVPRIATERPFAVDAAGARRDVTFSLSRDEQGFLLTAMLDTQGLAPPIVVDPAWQVAPTPVPSAGSAYVPVVLWLPSGKLFVTTGGTPSLFDPTSETWSLGKPVARTYNEPWAVLLSTGKVLISGVGNPPELWTEDAGGLVTPAMNATRGGTDVTPILVDAGLPTERVYFFGGATGTGGAVHASAERYDVATGTFTYVATMPAPRAGAAVARLDDGKILIAGGYASAALTSALLYDPSTNTYESLESTMPNAHRHARVVKLSSGKVMIVGGEGSTSQPTEKTTIYAPATKTFSSGPSMAWARRDFGVAQLAPGRFMVVGGNGRPAGATGSVEHLSAVETYDEATNEWKPEPSLTYPRYRPGIALLSGGRVLAVGGFGAAGANTSWEVLVPDPIACTSSSAGCTCVDGFCCDRPCDGQCEACDTPSNEGICRPIVGEAPHGARPACTPTLLCGAGGTCATTCSSDAACGASSWCTAGSSCAPKKENGAGCAAGNECSSGTCVDGVCCDAACTGQCEACDVAGKVGTCSPVLGAPHGDRAACTGGAACDGAGACTTSCTSDAQCASTHFCDAGACVPKRAEGDLCGSASACASGRCVDGVCCDSPCTGACEACDVPGKVGTCAPIDGPPRAGKSCAPYAACAAGSCATTCATDEDCTTTAYCLSGACVAKKTAGEACGSAGECATGICASGVCCDAACTGECESCALPGSMGTCTPKPATEPCGLAGCVGAATVTRGTCSGTDATCRLGTVTPCPGALKCADATACKTRCETGDDCVTGACDPTTGACVTSWDGGVPDSGTGSDAGGVTDSGADALPIADAPAPTVPAKPGVGDFQRCTADAECATGFCVEGVCCDSRCEDRCHSCALLDSPGKCILEPVGVDLKNECGPANACLGTCGPEGQCIGSGAGTMCARNRCIGPTQGVGPAYCAGPGDACPLDGVVPFDCAPYVCEPVFGACRTTCATSADCANGYLCDVPTKTCIAAPSAPADDGGCAIGSPGSRRAGASVAWGLLAVGALAVGMRRRRPRSEV